MKTETNVMPPSPHYALVCILYKILLLFLTVPSFFLSALEYIKQRGRKMKVREVFLFPLLFTIHISVKKMLYNIVTLRNSNSYYKISLYRLFFQV
jgi:hypothetical protein